MGGSHVTHPARCFRSCSPPAPDVLPARHAPPPQLTAASARVPCGCHAVCNRTSACPSPAQRKPSLPCRWSIPPAVPHAPQQQPSTDNRRAAQPSRPPPVAPPASPTGRLLPCLFPRALPHLPCERQLLSCHTRQHDWRTPFCFSSVCSVPCQLLFHTRVPCSRALIPPRSMCRKALQFCFVQHLFPATSDRCQFLHPAVCKVASTSTWPHAGRFFHQLHLTAVL